MINNWAGAGPAAPETDFNSVDISYADETTSYTASACYTFDRTWTITVTDNNGNEFFGAKFEGNTWDAINDNSYTVFHVNDFTDIPKMKRFGVGGLATPLILGGESAGGYTNGAGKCCNQIDHGCVSKLAELTNNSCA